MDEYTEEEKEILRGLAEEKLSIPAFLSKVVEGDDTIKVGNLNQEELGVSQLPVRTYKELELFCKKVCGDEKFANFFGDMAEIQTSTSLSKDAKLLNTLVTKKSEVADTTKHQKVNKGWFHKKEKEE